MDSEVNSEFQGNDPGDTLYIKKYLFIYLHMRALTSVCACVAGQRDSLLK